MDVLRIENLSKSFGGAPAVKDVSLNVPEGSVFGFIGANGAGKTTTMKMALGLLKPDGGEIFVCDEMVRFGMTATNRHVGYLPDVPYEIVPDRKEAVTKAINNAKSGDVVVLLAKGDENYQKVKGVWEFYESDLKIAQKVLAEKEPEKYRL